MVLSYGEYFFSWLQQWTETYVQMNINLRHPELPVIASNRWWSHLLVFLPAEVWFSWTENCWYTSNVTGFLAFLKHFGFTVEIIKLIQLIHFIKNYSEIRMVFPVRTICPPLEQRVPKDNLVSFSTLLFSDATMFLQRGPQRQPHTKDEDLPQDSVAGIILLCVRSLLQGDWVRGCQAVQ